MCEFIKREVINQTGFLSLNRPEALNALTLDMVQTLLNTLVEWEQDPQIHCIVLESQHQQAFCAGGDMKRIRQLALDKLLIDAERFFDVEYALNLTISQLKTDYVSLIDGLCIGGGVGLTIHGKYRIASEHATFVMPECKLGFFPDVGSSFFLPRFPCHLGYYLALTGEKIQGVDSIAVGYATDYIPSEKLPLLRAELAGDGSECAAILEKYRRDPAVGDIVSNLESINSVFSLSTLGEIANALEALDSPWARKTYRQLAGASPTSLHITWQLLHRGKHLDLQTCLEAEIATTRLMTPHADFIEGARAILVDKDHQPYWSTDSLFFN